MTRRERVELIAVNLKLHDAALKTQYPKQVSIKTPHEYLNVADSLLSEMELANKKRLS